MSIKLEGLDDVLDAIDIVDEAKLKRALGQACALVERSAKQNAPIGSGELRRSITSTIEGSGVEMAGVIYTPLEYAPYVEYGTGLFAEGGNGRKDVPWYIPIGNDFTEADAQKYHYPIIEGANGQKFARTYGSHPHPFMRPALNENRAEILRLLKEALLQ